MPVDLDEEEQRFRERIRDAIQTGGKVGSMAKKTGIPVGTLNKYVALRSTPSAPNAMRIARAVGLTVEELAAGASAAPVEEFPTRSNLVVPELLERLQRAARAAYKAAGQTPPDDRLAVEAALLYNGLLTRVADVRDAAVVDAVIPVLVRELEERLAHAAAEPGTGKRSA